jgi:predicted nuclease of restriction endonuclease-like (RecB) superfamily
LKLSQIGQGLSSPSDAIKEPLVLEFLGIPESSRLVESKLEEALINNLQHFLLELGKGFSFMGRQKRLTFDGDHYYADLVFYHVILKCYVIIELLCAASHKSSYVAKLLMCCIPLYPAKIRHFSYF